MKERVPEGLGQWIAVEKTEISNVLILQKEILHCPQIAAWNPLAF